MRSLPDKDQLPYALYRAQQVQALDRIAIEQYGIAGEILMERAGQAAFDALQKRWPDAQRILVLTGTGNNGGDGFVIARLALQANKSVKIIQLGDRSRLKGDALLNAQRFTQISSDWFDFNGRLPEADLIIDALLGTGLEREVSGAWAQAIEQINAQRVPVLAVDIPSGLHADTGAIMGTAVKADLTITFIGLKQGLFTGAGPEYCGQIQFNSLAVPAKLYANQILSARRLDWHKLRHQLSPRPRHAHKGDFGQVLIIGGDRGLGGAVLLSAQAALRSGAGLVSVFTRARHVPALLSARPEIMAHSQGLAELIARAGAIAIGPGLGQQAWGQRLWQQVLAMDKPLIVDADALNLLAQNPQTREDWILTPHPGEAARLLDCKPADIQQDRFAAAQALQQKYGGIVVLKGAGSLIAQANKPMGLCSQGNPGMASGGMGDALTGIIAALRAQGHAADLAAEMGVCLHAAAGDAAAAQRGEIGLLASDLIAQIQQLMQ